MKICGHWGAIPVRSVTGDVLAGLCPGCHRQLGYNDLIGALVDAYDTASGTARQATIRQDLADTVDARDAWEDLTDVR
jgi:hypothetical protein